MGKCGRTGSSWLKGSGAVRTQIKDKNVTGIAVPIEQPPSPSPESIGDLYPRGSWGNRWWKHVDGAILTVFPQSSRMQARSYFQSMLRYIVVSKTDGKKICIDKEKLNISRSPDRRCASTEICGGSCNTSANCAVEKRKCRSVQLIART